MSDPVYEKIGDPDDKACEECAEVIKAVMKANRFGLDGQHPLRGVRNGTEIRKEIIDCQLRLMELDNFLSEKGY